MAKKLHVAPDPAPLATPTLDAPIVVPYPAWRYHPTKPWVIVQSAKEDAALGDGWADTPAGFTGG
jgi:hypothetical protein